MPKIYRYHHPLFDRQVQLDDSLRQVSGPKVLITVEYVEDDFSAFHVTQVIDLLQGTFPDEPQKDVCVVCYVPRNHSVAMSKMEEELQNPHFGVYHIHYYDVDDSHLVDLTKEPSLPIPNLESAADPLEPVGDNLDPK